MDPFVVKLETRNEMMIILLRVPMKMVPGGEEVVAMEALAIVEEVVDSVIGVVEAMVVIGVEEVDSVIEAAEGTAVIEAAVIVADLGVDTGIVEVAMEAIAEEDTAEIVEVALEGIVVVIAEVALEGIVVVIGEVALVGIVVVIEEVLWW